MHEPLQVTPGTVAVFARHWLALCVRTRRNPRNVFIAAQRARDYLLPFLGDRPVVSLCADDIRAYRVHLEATGRLAPRTVRHLLGDLRNFLDWLVEGGYLTSVPMPRKILPRVPEALPDRLTDDEVRAVLAIPEPQAFVIRLGLSTGLRWGEMVGLHPGSLARGMLAIERTKNGRVRRVPLDPALQAEFIALRGPAVPYSRRANSSFSKFVRRHSGVSRFHVHQLRHTFACRWLERGGSLPALQEILGHRDITTTQMYARLSDDYVRSEYSRINGVGLREWRLPLVRDARSWDALNQPPRFTR